MATFKNKLAEINDPLAGSLLAATILWLRTLDGDIGYENYIRLCVPFSNDLYFGAHCPDPDARNLSVSDGSVLPVMNSGYHILWARHWRRELNLSHIQHVSNEIKVHMTWLEWALGTAIRKLWEAGIDWQPKPVKKIETIGGLEVADLDL